ncbi:MAG: hypothetical protein IKJ65_02665 [Clostridia bacterium]|nr:hypothetical protein [Clostridia bacterium]
MATYKLKIAHDMSFNPFFIIRVSKDWLSGVVIPHFTWYNVGRKTHWFAFKRKQVGPQRVLFDFKTSFAPRFFTGKRGSLLSGLIFC